MIVISVHGRTYIHEQTPLSPPLVAVERVFNEVSLEPTVEGASAVPSFEQGAEASSVAGVGAEASAAADMRQ